ncbi:MAG: prefoldin subunit alpha [Methanobacteriaceae archaeon]|nr:prefoldin subunit alpha [Methanobacteriaceae archaeon]
MEDQQKLEQMVNELNMYKSQAELLQQEIENVQQTIAEVNTLESTIEDMKKKDNVEALVPVGAGSFMNAEIKNDNKIVMSIGAGVAVTKNYDEAKETAESQKKQLEDSLGNLYNNLQQISDVINQLSPQAEQLMLKLQQSR